MRVLLRAWPKSGRDIGIEQVVELEACFEDEGDQFFIKELGGSIPVFRRPDVPEDGFDAEIHFELIQSVYLRLRPQWRHMKECTACPKRAGVSG